MGENNKKSTLISVISEETENGNRDQNLNKKEGKIPSGIEYKELIQYHKATIVSKFIQLDRLLSAHKLVLTKTGTLLKEDKNLAEIRIKFLDELKILQNEVSIIVKKRGELSEQEKEDEESEEELDEKEKDQPPEYQGNDRETIRLLREDIERYKKYELRALDLLKQVEHLNSELERMNKRVEECEREPNVSFERTERENEIERKRVENEEESVRLSNERSALGISRNALDFQKKQLKEREQELESKEQQLKEKEKRLEEERKLFEFDQRASKMAQRWESRNAEFSSAHRQTGDRPTTSSSAAASSNQQDQRNAGFYGILPSAPL